MLKLVRRLVDEMRYSLITIKPKPVRGFVNELCDDLRAYPEEWERYYESPYLSLPSSKTYSKGCITIALSCKDSVILWLYDCDKSERIHLTRKEKSLIYQATLGIERIYDEKRKTEQKIKDTEYGNTISSVLKYYRN